GHERILFSTTPYKETQLSVIGCRTMQVRKGADGVGKEHDAQARNDHVEARRLEWVNLRIDADEVRCRAFTHGAGSGKGDHRLGNVDAGATTAHSKQPCNSERSCACTAADIQNATRGPCGDRLDERVLERFENLVEQRLHLDPGASHIAVPERSLLFILPSD